MLTAVGRPGQETVVGAVAVVLKAAVAVVVLAAAVVVVEAAVVFQCHHRPPS